MPVAMSSLRVDLQGDATSYKAMASDKVNADALMIAADGRRIVSGNLVVQGLSRVERAQRGLTEQQQFSNAVAEEYVRQNSQIVALQQNQAAAANDNARFIHLSGVEAAQTANHVKTLAAALYVASPAFRELVNPAITASVRALGPAAISAGGAVISALTPAFAFISRIALPIAIAVDAFKLFVYTANLGAEKLAEWNKLASDAGAAGVGTSFFQQQTLAAKDYGLGVDTAADALKKFNDVNASALGGSTFDKKLKELTEAGNFSKIDAGAVTRASDLEKKYQATVDLITVAMTQGQRLAAIDLAATFAPPALLDRLRSNGNALREIQDAAEKTKPLDVVSVAQIGQAIELKTRLDAAWTTITDAKFAQDALTDAGVRFQHAWVLIVEDLALSVKNIETLVGWLGQIPSILQRAGNSSFWEKLGGGSMDKATQQAIIDRINKNNGTTAAQNPTTIATQQLGGLLKSPDAVQQGMRQSTDTEAAVWGDASGALKKYNDQMDVLRSLAPKAFEEETKLLNLEKAKAAFMSGRAALSAQAGPGQIDVAAMTKLKLTYDKAVAEINNPQESDAWTRFIDQTHKAEAAVVATTQTVGLAAGVHERLKIQLQGEAILERDGVKDTEARRTALAALAAQAGETATALEKARIADKIKFDRGTSLLSSEDVQIANQLKGIYGTDIPAALASSEAAAIRMNIAMADVSNQISGNLTTALADFTTGAKPAGDAFRSFGLTVIRTIDEMIIKLAIIRPLQAGLQSFFGGGAGLFGSGGGATDVNNGYVPFIDGGGIVASRRNGGMVDSSGPYAYVHPAYYENAPRMRNGGYITDDGVPIVAHPGERILNRAETAEYNKGSGGSKSPAYEVHLHNDFRGVPPEAVSSIVAQLRVVKKQVQKMPETVKQVRNWRPSTR